MKKWFLFVVSLPLFGGGNADEFKRVIVKSDRPVVEKFMNDDERFSLLMDEIRGTEKNINALAQEVVDVREEKDRLAKSIAWYRNKHIQRIISGSALMLMGLVKGGIDIGYKSDDTDTDKDAGLFLYDFFIDFGLMSGGAYYVANGVLQRTPKIKLEDAKSIVSLIYQKLSPKAEV